MENKSVVVQEHERPAGRRWRAEVFVSLKPVVNDPQGLAVRDGLQMLGYGEVEAVRAGKYIELWLSADDRDVAGERVCQMCEKLLANPMIEQYHFRLSPADSRQAAEKE
jgi:phosphoribosylformylglycinamidine synthase PurS subunit